MTDQTLKELFTQFGQVNSAKISVDILSGRNKHFGYVQMEHTGDAQTAILELNGLAIEDQIIGVVQASQK